MPQYKLTYFDAATSRGEECRLALHVAGLPFEDERLTRDQWAARKASTPFGALPVLAIDGRQLAQSNAILRFIGSQHGLHPVEPLEAALHESLMCAVEDLRTRMGPIIRIKDEAEKKRARQEAAGGYLQEWGAAIERQIGAGPYLAGMKLCVADLKLFVAADRKSTRLNSSHGYISYAVFCLKKKKKTNNTIYNSQPCSNRFR